MDYNEYNIEKQEALNYFAFLVEDRMGMSSEIIKSDTSVEINLHEGATLTHHQAHTFCINLTVICMNSFGVFIPFKLRDQDGNLITLESYISDSDEGTIIQDTPFIVNDEDDEEFFNFG